MQLVIDIGNTRVKTGLFDKDELLHFFVFQSFDEFISANLPAKFPIQKCIIASVVNEFESIANFMTKTGEVFIFTSQTPTPLINLYESAHTLGSDRLAAAVGASCIFPNQNLLIVDAGTCIKYNFVSANNEYLGGGISPGLQMRFKALNHYTSRLPLIQTNSGYNELIGKNTTNSILSGVEIGSIAEINGIIERYEKQYPSIKVVLTGGDVNFFEKRLKNSIFADPFLILKGLNVILNFNSKAVSK